MTLDLLLVDDESGIRKVLGISLADKGYQVHTAEEGRQALQMFDAVRPAIVLTDIKMPGMDGLELLREIKRRNADTEVIMITGHGDLDLAVQSLKDQASDYIIKPIEEDILDLALGRARERIKMRRQLRHYTENLERLVEEKSNRLVQAERLAAVGETITAIAHAVKNIAGGLRGGAFIVEKGLALGNEAHIRRGWQMTHDNVARIEQLALDLLNIARPGRPVFTPTDPLRPIEEVFQLMEPQAQRKGICLRLQLEDHLPLIPMEMESIHRCLLNLVINAIDACARQREDHPELPSQPIVMACRRRADGIVYRIEDHGGGIEPELQAKIFQTFFSTKGSRGTGIGLMLSRKIIDAHHGRLDVRTEYGSGSVFDVWLPDRQPNGQPEKNVDETTHD